MVQPELCERETPRYGAHVRSTAAVCAGEAPGSRGGAWGRAREVLPAHHDAVIACPFHSNCLGAGRGAVGCETGTSPGGRATVSRARRSHPFAPLPPRRGVRRGIAERVGGLTVVGLEPGAGAGPRDPVGGAGLRFEAAGYGSPSAASDGVCDLSPFWLGLLIFTLQGSWVGPAGVTGPVGVMDAPSCVSRPSGRPGPGR